MLAGGLELFEVQGPEGEGGERGGEKLIKF